MSPADRPPDADAQGSLQPLAYQSASDAADLRWIARMLSLLMVGHAIGAAASAAMFVLPGLSGASLFIPAIRLPAVVLFSLAGALLAASQRRAYAAVVAAYTWHLLQLAVPAAVLMIQRISPSWMGASTGYSIAFVSGGSNILIGILEAVAVTAIVARCRKAGALGYPV